jgi:hypothetical protein
MSIYLSRATVGNGLPLHDSGVRVIIPDSRHDNNPAAPIHDVRINHNRDQALEEKSLMY